LVHLSSFSDWSVELGEPAGTQYQGVFSNPDVDVSTDNNDQCYVTGNSGGDAGSDDVDNGSVTLTTPAMKLAGGKAKLSFYYWFFNNGGQGTSPNDKFTVSVISSGQTVTIFTGDSFIQSVALFRRD
jgi:hypothetical protein